MGKCTKTSYCNMISECIQDHHNKGIVSIDVTDSTNGEIKHIGLAYKKSTKDRGIMLNVCPFYGEKIQHWENNGK